MTPNLESVATFGVLGIPLVVFLFAMGHVAAALVAGLIDDFDRNTYLGLKLSMNAANDRFIKFYIATAGLSSLACVFVLFAIAYPVLFVACVTATGAIFITRGVVRLHKKINKHIKEGHN